MLPSFLFTGINRKAIRTIILCLCFAAACQPRQEERVRKNFSGTYAMECVAQQLSFGPRYPGSSGHAEIQTWIVEELSQLGWNVEKQTFTYRDTKLINIIAFHPNATGRVPILLGAHYDTRKFADRDLEEPSQPVPGANDGASGVAILMELARIYADGPPVDLTIVFFDGEDQGHIDDWDWSVGSQYFVDHLDRAVQAAVIVDMVGDQDLGLPYELSSDEELVKSIWGTAEMFGYSAFRYEPGHSIIDDHLPFLQHGIPAVDIIDFDYAYWHTRADQIDKVSSKSLQQVGATLEVWLSNLSTDDGNVTQ
jgi:glutaminyl-peptide cyclotransferase